MPIDSVGLHLKFPSPKLPFTSMNRTGFCSVVTMYYKRNIQDLWSKHGELHTCLSGFGGHQNAYLPNCSFVENWMLASTFGSPEAGAACSFGQNPHIEFLLFEFFPT